MAKNLADYAHAARSFLTSPRSAPPLETKASEAAKVAFAWLNGIEQYPPRDYRKLTPYAKTNPIVRRALKLCGEGVASLEPIVKIKGQEVDSATTHPQLAQIMRYLKKPNQVQDGASLIAAVTAFYKASGNGWLEYVPGLSGMAEFYALRPERMNIIPGPNGWPIQYIYDPGTGRKKAWPVNIERGKSSILHIRDFALDNDLYAHGALEAADKALAIYESAWVLAKAMFDNSAMPAGMLVYSPKVPAGTSYPSLSAEQRVDLQKRLDEKFKGPKNRGKPMVTGEDLRWEPMGSSLVDMEAIALRESAARDIANAFGVPPMLLCIPGDTTYSNFTEASRGFYRNTVFADARAIYGAIGRWFSSLTGIADLEITFDEEKAWALADELSALWARVDSADGLSLDEKRKAKGYSEMRTPESVRPLVRAGYATIEDIIGGDLGLYGDRSIEGGVAEVLDDDAQQTENLIEADPRQLPAPPKK